MSSGSTTTIKSSWDDMTVGDILFMKETEKLQMATEDEKNMMVAARLAGIEYRDFIQLPLSEVRKYMDNTDFLFAKPEGNKVKRSYKINGRVYKLFKGSEEMTVAQYIDFQAVQADGFDKRPAEMLAIFLVPEGHQYNDGYDKDQQIEDMLDMSITDALGVCDFFTKRLSKSISLILTALKIRMKWMRITARKEDREMMKALEIQMRLYLDQINHMYGWML